MSIEIKPGLTITREQQLELRRAGIAALRSGEFKQYWGALENGGCNCPMGVFCRVFDRMFPGVLEIKVGTISGATSFDGHAGNIPKVVQLAFGFRTIRGSYGAEGRYITMDNDGLGLPLEKIADIIESNPPGLWVDEGVQDAG